MKRLFFLIAVCTAILTLFSSSSMASVLDVLAAGQSKIWVDTYPRTTGGTDPAWVTGDGALVDGQDNYFTSLYDDATSILVLFGNDGMHPKGESGYAYVYQLSGTPTGDRILTEIPTATVGGVTYTNYNIYLGHDPAVITFSKSGGSPTYNKLASVVGGGSAEDVILTFLDGNGDGIFDSVNSDHSAGGWTEVIDLDQVWRRQSADLGEGMADFWLIDNPHWFDAPPPKADVPDTEMIVANMWLPITSADAVVFQTVDEVLIGIPRDTTTWTEPPAPKYAGGPGGTGGGNDGGNGGGDNPPYNDTSDFLDDACFARAAHVPPYNAAHMKALAVFKSSKAYSIITLIGLGLFSLLGIGLLRRKGFGKGL